MSYPIPVITKINAAQTLGQLYLNMMRSRPKSVDAQPCLLLTLPTAWANKYQILLYGGAARHGFAVAGITTPEDLAHVDWPGPIILHTHWFAALFQGAANPKEAQMRLDQTKTAISAFKARTGARLIWTAHNVFPHGNDHPEAFLALRQWIFETFNGLHIMEDDHLAILEQSYERSAPHHFTVPHMLYTGSLPTGVDRATARAHFGIPHGSTVFGYFGSIQAYKRISMIIDARDSLPQDHSVRILIGGVPADQDEVRRLQARIGIRRDVILLPRTIQDHEIQYLHAASDVMVLPYAETLNSGAAMMSASFRKPFLTPKGIAATALTPLGADLFDGGDPHGLTQAMVGYIQGTRTPPQINDDAWHARQPALVSDAFFNALKVLS
jgi:beta-1,4-mannosyltransferase